MFLEVIAKNFEDAKLINESNANRIEFCNDLEVGGLTPTIEDIIELTNFSKLPVNVIVRFSHDNFFFTEEELKKQLEFVAEIAKTKTNGIVIGAITKDFKINEDFLEKLNKVRGKLEITFHKAFDQVLDKIEGLKVLDKFNITNVLTSGGEFLEQNWEILLDMAKFNSKVKILIGGGVTINNLPKCLEISKNIHIGTAARTNNTWIGKISLDKIEEFK